MDNYTNTNTDYDTDRIYEYSYWTYWEYILFECDEAEFNREWEVLNSTEYKQVINGINPYTKRKIKINGATHQELLRSMLKFPQTERCVITGSLVEDYETFNDYLKALDDCRAWVDRENEEIRRVNEVIRKKNNAISKAQ